MVWLRFKAFSFASGKQNVAGKLETSAQMCIFRIFCQYWDINLTLTTHPLWMLTLLQIFTLQSVYSFPNTVQYVITKKYYERHKVTLMIDCLKSNCKQKRCHLGPCGITNPFECTHWFDDIVTLEGCLKSFFVFDRIPCLSGPKRYYFPLIVLQILYTRFETLLQTHRWFSLKAPCKI